jgi:NADPH:quinone reductase-like Zn-dependent oxidoreductase
MKAVLYRTYGSPDVLHCEETEKPRPGDDEVLIRIRAAAVNPMDCHFMSGTYIMRPMTGLFKPKPTCPGVDLAGEVEAVGSKVTRFRPGDAVFGVGRGALAEYACARENKLALKPANLTFEAAAAIPVAGLTALQGLRDKGRIQRGQNVLINGAAGGVGTFAVQIAKSFGANVTAVCSTRNTELVRSIGADHVVDYSREDFTRIGQRFDLLFDCVGNRSLFECRRVLTPTAIIVPCGARPGGRWIGPLPTLLKLLVSSRFVKQKVVFFIASVGTDDLNVLKTLIEAGQVTPVIDRRYTLDQAHDAIAYLKEGHAKGKVVLLLRPSNSRCSAGDHRGDGWCAME